MKKRILILMLAFALVFVFAACSENTETEPVTPEESTTAEEPFTQEEIDAAQAVIQEYVRAFNAKDREAALATMTEYHNAPNVILWEGEETLEIEITSYDPNDPDRESYLTSGRGSENGATLENVIVFLGNYILTYPDGTVDSYDGWKFILIRENAESPWKIDDWGY